MAENAVLSKVSEDTACMNDIAMYLAFYAIQVKTLNVMGFYAKIFRKRVHVVFE